MSLEKKDVHIRLEESIHSRLSVLAGLDNDGIAEHAVHYLRAAESEFSMPTLFDFDDGVAA